MILLNQDGACHCSKLVRPFNNFFHLPSSGPLAIVETQASLRFLSMRKEQDLVTRSSYWNTDTTRRQSLL
jgi:hypothetical protein